MNVELRKDLVELLRETGRAHHSAFMATDGVDPEWPIWYAEHLQAPIADALGTPFTKSQLVYCVMDADFEQTARAPEIDWSEFYADQFVERYARSAAPSEDKLVLYHSRSCPFCALVTSAVDRLGLDVVHKRATVGRDEHGVLAADLDVALRVARVLGVFGGCRRLDD